MQIRNLLFKTLVFFLLLTATYIFALWQLSLGQVDYFYNKFNYKASSLVIGSSRALYGISPSVIEQNLKKNEIDYPILNFGFAREISDYGPIYLNAIQKKLLPETKNGLFILEVNPGSLAIHNSKVDTISTLQNDITFLSTLREFNKQPNLEYIRKYYTHSLYKGFQRSRRIDLIRYSHPDGWLEVLNKYQYYEVSEKEISIWRDMNVKGIGPRTKNFKPSKARLQYLEETINYLKDFGQVYLVRIPIYTELLEIEQSFWHNFDEEINELAKRNQIHYFDYSKEGNEYLDYDGSHLFGSSAKAFTQKLCIDINNLQNIPLE